MPIRVQKFFIAICPVCKKKIDLGGGDCDFTVHQSRGEIKELVDYTSDYFPLEGHLADACSGECGKKYYAERAKRLHGLQGR